MNERYCGHTQWPIACPVCDAPVHKKNQSLVCPKGHSFDIARQGYVNLLVSQHQTRGIDGDTAEMLQARRRFLAAKHYLPLYELLHDLTQQAIVESKKRSPDQKRCVLEVGCGEGYYIGNLATALSDTLADTVYVGMDVSKTAAAYAARRYESVFVFVGDVHRRIYVQDRSVTVLLNVFSPRNATEFARIVQPNGYVLTVIPAESHLASLRTELNLLDIEEDKEERVLERLADNFRIADRHELRYPLRLPPEGVKDLVHMGPNFWHQQDASEVGTAPIDTEASFIILQLERHATTTS